MNSCAYCGKNIDSNRFICESCSNPKQEASETPLDKTIAPAPAKQMDARPEVLTTKKQLFVEQLEDNKVEKQSSSHSPVQSKNAKPGVSRSVAIDSIIESPKVQIEVSDNDKQPITIQNRELLTTPQTQGSPPLDSTAWKEEPTNDDLSSKVVIFNLFFIVLPLVAMVVVTLFIKMEATLKVEIIIAISFFFALSTAAHFIEMRWLKYVSYVYRTTKPVDAYIYLENPLLEKNSPIVIRIYDEDKMYPEFSEITSISPKIGNVELLGVKPQKPDELVAVEIRAGQFGPLKAMILEANGHRVWCKFK